jgi:CheY-like chemotaxis protein/predicted Ser/Thr protein kinase
MTLKTILPALTGKVLIVDDVSIVRRLIKAYVQEEGHAVFLACNGQEALALLARENVDVIVLDVYMPVTNGFEVLQAVKQNPDLAHLPILMISEGGDPNDLVRCIEMGAVDYLAKPLNKALLRARLATCIQAKRKREQELWGLRLRQPVKPNDTLPSGETPPPSAPEKPGPPAGSCGQGTRSLRLGNIVLDRFLGAGSIGEVYLGYHELLDLPVAVKILRQEWSNCPEMRQRLLHEAHLAARVLHANIARLNEVGEHEGTYYLAYEYVEGGTLEQYLKSHPQQRLEAAEAVRVTRAICEGLTETHRLGIIHRDIKPANILLTRDGKIKLADLGLAWQIGLPQSLSAAEPSVVGTPLYMAPEQIRGQKDLDIRTDLYAVGCVLYELLTGSPPFAFQKPRDVLAAHQTQVPRPLQELCPEIPAWLDAVCLKLLAKDRAERFQTPEEVLATLHNPTESACTIFPLNSEYSVT